MKILPLKCKILKKNLLEDNNGFLPIDVKQYFSNISNNHTINHKRSKHELTQIDKYYNKIEPAAFYIYQINDGISSQIGLLSALEINPCIDNTKQIIPHEEICPKKMWYYLNDFVETKEQYKPLLLFHKESEKICSFLFSFINGKPAVNLTDEAMVRHRLWHIDANLCKKRFSKIYDEIDQLFIADGHHRYEAIKHYHSRYKKNIPINMMCYIVPNNHLNIYPFSRIITNIDENTKIKLLDALSINFNVSMVGEYSTSESQSGFNMYFNGQWYLLNLKGNTETINSKIGIQFLSEYVLKSIFSIPNQRSNPNVQFINPMSSEDVLNYQKIVDNQNAIMFLLNKFNIDLLLKTIKIYGILPPNSTFFKHKPLDGLCRFAL
jgi:uncharacterized protein (DUF1015 family)